MNRFAAIAMVLVGCGGPVDEPPIDPPFEPGGDDLPLPDGVWEPIAGADIWDASLAADGETIWWIVTRKISPAGEYLFDDQVWMTATSTSGVRVVAPFQVAPAYPYSHEPDIVVTPSAVVAKIGTVDPMLQRYDRDGQPLDAPYVLALEDGEREIVDFGQTELIATVDGGAQYVAALGDDSHEVVLVDLDAAGMPQSTRFAGTPVTVDGGSKAYNVAAAARADGSTVVAWSRGFNGCVSERPSSTLTAMIDISGFGTVQSVHDAPASEFDPAVAARGDTAYIAWRIPSGNDTRIQLARYPAVTTVVAELGEPGRDISDMSIVLAAPARGVIAWQSSGSTVNSPNVLHVTPFEDREGLVYFGVTYVVPQIDTDASMGGLSVAHVGDDRYVVGWTEYRRVGYFEERVRLYATELDFAGTSMRRAPVLEAPVAPTQPRRRRCV